MTISFFVPGLPAPGGSKRAFVVKGRAVLTEDSRGSKPWRERVASVASEHHAGPPLAGPLDLRVTFYRQRPKGHFGTGRNAAVLKLNAPPYPTGKPDTTKLLRSTEDALKGILWVDDSLVVDQHAFKRWGERPGAMVEVREIDHRISHRKEVERG